MQIGPKLLATFALALLPWFVLSGCGDSSPSPDVGATKAAVFKPGQVWTYGTRPQESASRVVILLVETDSKLGSIVHIRIEGLALKSSRSPNGLSDHIAHLPYAGRALSKYVKTLESTRAQAQIPGFRGGYQEWKAEFDAGRAGVFTASLSECLDGIESGIKQ